MNCNSDLPSILATQMEDGIAVFVEISARPLQQYSLKWCNKAFETIFDLTAINISECFTSPIFVEFNNIHSRRQLSLYDIVKDFQRQINNGVSQLQLLLEVTVGSQN